jgi:hypothetical protein
VSEIADFLRARYREAKEREQQKSRGIPSPFDGHDVELVSDEHGQRLLVDGHPYPIEKWREVATEPAPDPDVIADLDAKLALVDDLLAEGHVVIEDPWYTCSAATEEHDGGRCCDDNRRGNPCDCGRDARVNRRLAILAQPYAGHRDHKSEEWAP